MPRRDKKSNSCRSILILFVLICFGLTGCGTTKWSDTSRTATEQLLITSAMDDVIDEFNFYPLTGRKVYIKKEGITCTDSQYLISILRQQLAANGVLVKDVIEDADYILEIAPGAVGTNRYDLMYGIPRTEVPSLVTGGGTSTIPEVSLIKRTDQKAQVKMMMWAYNRKTGTIIWQSGSKTKTAHIRDRWFFGIGPITHASFNKKMQVSGEDVKLPATIVGGNFIGEGRPSVQTEAIYKEIDQKSIEKLELIREAGKYRLLREKPESTEEENDPKSELPTKAAIPPAILSATTAKEHDGDLAPKNTASSDQRTEFVAPNPHNKGEHIGSPLSAPTTPPKTKPPVLLFETMNESVMAPYKNRF